MSKPLDPKRPPAKLYLRATHATRRALQKLANERSLQEDRRINVSDLLREMVEKGLAQSSRKPARR